MRLGIYAGGFKPFHSGHFAKLVLASRENDSVLLIWGGAGRSKGSGISLTPKNIVKMWEGYDGWTGVESILQRSISNLTYVNQANHRVPFVNKGGQHKLRKATPIGDVYGLIEAMTVGSSLNLTDYGLSEIVPSDTTVTIYVGPQDSEHYRRMTNTDIFEGFQVDSGFDDGGQDASRLMRAQYAIEVGNLDEYVNEMPELIEEERSSLIRRFKIRGSEIRSLPREEAKNYLPAIYTDFDKQKVLDLMFTQCESTLRNFVGAVLVG